LDASNRRRKTSMIAGLLKDAAAPVRCVNAAASVQRRPDRIRIGATPVRGANAAGTGPFAGRSDEVCDRVPGSRV